MPRKRRSSSMAPLAAQRAHASCKYIVGERQRAVIEFGSFDCWNRRSIMERRKFTREFKLEAVRLIKERGVSYAQASQDLGG